MVTNLTWDCDIDSWPCKVNVFDVVLIDHHLWASVWYNIRGNDVILRFYFLVLGGGFRVASLSSLHTSEEWQERASVSTSLTILCKHGCGYSRQFLILLVFLI